MQIETHCSWVLILLFLTSARWIFSVAKDKPVLQPLGTGVSDYQGWMVTWQQFLNSSLPFCSLESQGTNSSDPTQAPWNPFHLGNVMLYYGAGALLALSLSHCVFCIWSITGMLHRTADDQSYKGVKNQSQYIQVRSASLRVYSFNLQWAVLILRLVNTSVCSYIHLCEFCFILCICTKTLRPLQQCALCRPGPLARSRH